MEPEKLTKKNEEFGIQVVVWEAGDRNDLYVWNYTVAMKDGSRDPAKIRDYLWSKASGPRMPLEKVVDYIIDFVVLAGG
jgi:hypothetical protein